MRLRPFCIHANANKTGVTGLSTWSIGRIIPSMKLLGSLLTTLLMLRMLYVRSCRGRRRTRMGGDVRVQMDLMTLKSLVSAFRRTFWIEIWLSYEKVMAVQRLGTSGCATTERRRPT